ncbi:MAG TPA: NADH-quinone oxidoreductase subunit C [Nitrospiria bacterium]|nr:NADH-quinone oxidoreductase subunit C [Nitrospiria bacterium]
MNAADIATQQIVRVFEERILNVSRVFDIPIVSVAKEDIPAIARYIHGTAGLRGTLSMQWAVDLRPMEARSQIYCLFSLVERGAWLILLTELPDGDRLHASITPHIHAAKWYEREIRDQFGLIPVGHPDLRRLVRHEHWPKGTHALRKDFAWNHVMGRQPGEYRFRHIEGEGVFEVPVGPIHAGIIEPGHFRFSVAGEPVMQLELRHFWKHRGVEKLFEIRTLVDGVSLAERVSGDTSFGHSLAYCETVERLMGITVPPRARYLRTLFLELERLHNHIGDVGAICNDAAYALALAHSGRIKERVMQLADRLTGSRFLRGVNVVGGTAIDLSPAQLDEVIREADAIHADFGELAAIVFENASLTDRLESTGVLSEQTAWDHGVMGVVGRASNVDRDVRRDHPFAAYTDLRFRVPVFNYGDVRARVRIRIEEAKESISLIRQVRERLPSGEVRIPPPGPPDAGQWALGAVEGWRGEILYYVMAGENGAIHRCKVRDPSFVNWPAIQFAVLGNIIPDFPLINKSFNLSYAGTDL